MNPRVQLVISIVLGSFVVLWAVGVGKMDVVGWIGALLFVGFSAFAIHDIFK